MGFDPSTMMMLVSMLAPMIGGGQDAKTGSSFSEGQQGNIQALNDFIQKQSQGGNQGMDITQNKNYGTGQDWLQSMFNDPEFFNKFEAPMQRQFEENTVPDLANRFASMGSGGALGSTGFRNQLAREGSNLQSNMAAQRGMMQQNAIPQLMQYAQQPFSNMMNMYQQATQQPVNNQYFPATPGPYGEMGASFAGGFSNAAGQTAGENMMKSWKP